LPDLSIARPAKAIQAINRIIENRLNLWLYYQLASRFGFVIHGNRYLIFILAFLGLTGCTRTQPIRLIESAHFLNDYILHKEALKEGEETALLSFRKKNVNWSIYNKVILAPVLIKKTQNSGLNKMTHADVFQLKESLEYWMQDGLKNSFKFVSKAGADTLVIQLSITDMETATVLQDTFSKAYPAPKVLAELKLIGFGTESLVGKTSIEIVIKDSDTGEMVMEATDLHAGNNPFIKLINEGYHSQEGYKQLANQLSFQLCQLKHRFDCQKPSLLE